MRWPGSAVRARGALGMAVLLVALGGLAWLLLAVRPVLIPFALAVAMAYVLAPAVSFLEGQGWPRPWAILVLYAVLAVAGALLVLGVAPVAIRQLDSLLRSVPVAVRMVRQQVEAIQVRTRAPGMPFGIQTGVDRFLQELEARSDRLLTATIAGVPELVEWVLYATLAPFLAYYLLRDLPDFHRVFVRSLPRCWRGGAVQLLRELDGVLSGFVRGELLLALAVGGLAALATYLLGLPYSLLLGAWAALSELVPYVGPVAGAVPATAIALAISPVRAVQVVLAFALIQQLESAVLGPHVMGNSVGLHPLVVLFSILAGGYLSGVWGMILAVPVAGAARVLWRFLIGHLTSPPPDHWAARADVQPFGLPTSGQGQAARLPAAGAPTQSGPPDRQPAHQQPEHEHHE